MGQKMWLGTKVMKTKYHHSEDPKYGQPFQIMAIQFENINGEFTDWIEDGEIQFGSASISSFEYLNMLRKMGETDLEWKRIKSRISDDLCKDINTLIDMCTNLNKVTRAKEVAAYKVHYLGDPKDTYQIL